MGPRFMTPSQSSTSSTLTQPTRILIADRNRMASQLLSESLGRDPRFEIVAVATAADLLPIVATQHPHVVLISADLDSGTKKGLQVARNLNSHHPNIHIVMLLETGTRESVIAAFRCGAAGVFCRTDPVSELPTCIERVSQGEICAGKNHAQFLLGALRNAPSCEGVTGAKIDLHDHTFEESYFILGGRVRATAATWWTMSSVVTCRSLPALSVAASKSAPRRTGSSNW